MNDEKSIYFLLGEVIGDFVIVFLIAWGLVSSFALTWGQGIIISWMFFLLRDSIRSLRK